MVQSFKNLRAKHDVIILTIDSSDVFNLPALAAGWIRVADVETGREVVVSRKKLNGLAKQIREYQQRIIEAAKDLGLNALLLSADKDQLRWQLMDFFLSCKQRKISA